MIPLFAEVVTQQQAIHMVLHNLLASLTYGIAGIGLMVAAFKTFDWMTPGHLARRFWRKETSRRRSWQPVSCWRWH